MANTALQLGGQSNAQLTRTFERIFDEAQISGELKLSGRKLKDFPKIAIKYDLSDTVKADLSKNRFTDLPCEVCEYFLLERLDCYHNVVRCVPDSVITLQSLAYLNLSRNQLSTIPPSLCQLPLQVLNLSNNKLVSLPEEIGDMPCLDELDVSCNEISILPPQMGDLHSLRSLNIRRNRLVELRPEVCELRLVKLDISGNCISTLPTTLKSMVTLQELYLDHNPLTSPPAFLCTRGKVHIFKYLEIQSIKEDKKKGALLESEFRRSGRKPANFGTDLRFQNGFASDIHKKRCTVDSGYNTSDGCDKRWSQDLQELNGEVEESRNMTLRAAEYVKGQRHQRLGRYDSSSSGQRSCRPHQGSPVEDSREERRRTARNLFQEQTSDAPKMGGGEGTVADKRNTFSQHVQTYREYKEALKQQRENVYRKSSLEDNTSNSSSSQSSPHSEGGKIETALLPTMDEYRVKQEAPRSHQQNEAPVVQRRPWDNKYATTTGVSEASNGKALHNGTSATATTTVVRSPSRREVNPHFTIRRELDKEKEERELLRQMRKVIEGRLKVILPEDMALALTDGVVLCHLANNVRPHSVATIHVPSPAVPTLSQPKCRRNVENFLDACRRIGVREEATCTPQDILNIVEKGLVRVAVTIHELVEHGGPPGKPYIT